MDFNRSFFVFNLVIDVSPLLTRFVWKDGIIFCKSMNLWKQIMWSKVALKHNAMQRLGSSCWNHGYHYPLVKKR